MKNEDGPLARVVDLCWAAFQEYGRFVWVYYGGEAVLRTADVAHRTSRTAPEKAP